MASEESPARSLCVYEFVSQQAFTNYLVGPATGSAYPAVKPQDFEAALIVHPTEDLLGEFDRLASPTQRGGASLYAQIRLLERARDLLLPRLVTGAIEVGSLGVNDVFGWAELTEASAPS